MPQIPEELRDDHNYQTGYEKAEADLDPELIRLRARVAELEALLSRARAICTMPDSLADDIDAASIPK